MALLAVFLLVLGGGFLAPWWWPALAGYAVGCWLCRSGGWAIASGFLGTGGAWLALAAFQDWRNHHLLSARMADMFHLPYPWMLLVLTAVIGGILGGLAAWAGQALRAALPGRRAGSGRGAVPGGITGGPGAGPEA